MKGVKGVVQVNSLFHAIKHSEAAIALTRSIDCAAVASIHGRVTGFTIPDIFRSGRHADEDVCRWSGTGARLRSGPGLGATGWSDRGQIGRLPSAPAPNRKLNR